ncbi:MAG: hypothetical protein ACQKBW_07780 [Puniceicoccales bacterium]
MIFEVIRQNDGTFHAWCPSEGIQTRGSDLAELHGNINAALDECFVDRERPHPSRVRLLVTSE